MAGLRRPNANDGLPRPKEAKEGQEALDLKTSEDTAATTRFETHTAKIDGILTTDLKYLEDERAAIVELQALLAKLNLKGDYTTTGAALVVV